MILLRKQLLLEQIDPRSRIDLVAARRKAMGGQLDAALAQLDDRIRAGNDSRLLDLVALTMLKAELLLLDGRADRSKEVFDHMLVPRLGQLSPELSIVIEHNRNDVELALLTPESGRSFYDLVDRQRLVGLELADASEIADAQDAAADGKHYEALPSFWREVTRTYRQACWRPHRWAAKWIARECLQIGLPHEAAYHIVVAQDGKLAKEVGDQLLARRDARAIRRTVVKLMATANLQRHFSTACEILTQVGDGIGDDQVDLLASWLMPRCSLVPVNSEATTTLKAAWEALEPIARRLSLNLAREAIATAVSHPYWTTVPSSPNSVFLAREQMVETVSHLAFALPASDLDALARQTVPLAKERMQNHDYPHVINLLCHIADRAGSTVKEWIGEQLFPPGEPVTFFVGQVAANFGKPFLPSDRMASAANQVAHNLSLQVQRLSPNEEPKPVPGGLMTYTSSLGDGKIVVTVAQGVELHAMARHCSSIPADALRHLVESAVTVISDKENFLSNRASAINGVMEFGGHLPQDLAERLLDILMPLAQGEIEEPTTVPTATITNNPLNPYKFKSGTPAQVTGIALKALARIGAPYSDTYGPKIQPILEDALGDLNSEVRRFAFAAAREMPRLSEAAIMAVLLGTRDPDPNAAASAFAALATKADLHLTRSQWQLFIYAAKMASQSPATPLRRMAASALSRLTPLAPNAVVRTKASDLLKSMVTDVCASVREAAAERENGV